MALSKKNAAGIAVAAAVVALIAIGAVAGRTRETKPAETFGTGDSPAARAGDTSGLAPDGSELKVVRTYTRRDCGLAPWLVTDKLGYFAEEGVRLVFTGEVQPPQRVPSILSGTNDTADLHPNALAVAINGGAKFKGVARSGVEPPEEFDPGLRHMWWFVNPEKYPGVKSFADLRDIPGTLKFSIIATNSCSDFLANLILDHYGIPRDKVEWVNMPDVQAIQALKQGLTDVGGVHPPFYKGMLDAGQVKVADTSETGLEPQVAGLGFYFFTEDFIASNPEAVRGFVRAMTRGQKWINENQEQARVWTEEAIGVPVSANHYYSDTLGIVDEQVTPWLRDLEDSGVVPRGKLKISDIVTHEFDELNFASSR
ncbi:MAG: ABC transporter substrate-binding protein [Deltaproteobacteria bacterium]|jgi:ABC-type nitrate/sulfonate/bicarbonate transport system substrate-binding protein|nr:ABC transporter substrate-binding protein [Deltaproteobacteria bacterium]